MASWQRTKPPAVASALPRAGWRDGICLHQHLLMLPQPAAEGVSCRAPVHVHVHVERRVSEPDVHVRSWNGRFQAA